MSPEAKALFKEMKQEIGRFGESIQLRVRPDAKDAPTKVIAAAMSAAAQNKSLEELAKPVFEMSADTMFYHLQSKLDLEVIEAAMEHNVQRGIQIGLRLAKHRHFSLAIDFHDEYTHTEHKENPYVVGTKPGRGTSYCFKYMTVALTTPGFRYMLFAYPVEKFTGEMDGKIHHTDMILLLNRALDFVRRLGVSFNMLCLDKEFSSTDVVALLSEVEIRFITPAKQDKKFLEQVKRCPSIPAIVEGWKMSNDRREEVQTTLAILREMDEGDDEPRIYGYITSLPKEEFASDPNVLSRIYAHRWGIETNHRMLENFEIATTTPDGVVRYFFFVVSMVLFNIWVWTNAQLQKGPFKPMEFKIKIKASEINFIFVLLMLEWMSGVVLDETDPAQAI